MTELDRNCALHQIVALGNTDGEKIFLNFSRPCSLDSYKFEMLLFKEATMADEFIRRLFTDLNDSLFNNLYKNCFMLHCKSVHSSTCLAFLLDYENR